MKWDISAGIAIMAFSIPLWWPKIPSSLINWCWRGAFILTLLGLFIVIVRTWPNLLEAKLRTTTLLVAFGTFCYIAAGIQYCLNNQIDEKSQSTPSISSETAMPIPSQSVVPSPQPVANNGKSKNQASGEFLGSWKPMALEGAPFERKDHSLLWTGSKESKGKIIIWGGDGHNGRRNSGAIYNPSLDRWEPMSDVGAPTLANHTEVWTGEKMIVWGSSSSGGYAGAIYDLKNNKWTSISMVGAPSSSASGGNFKAVWTGTEMIVWGGFIGWSIGGKYNPSTDTWLPMNMENSPSGRVYYTAVWTGREMIVWGGTVAYGGVTTNTGSAYDPSANKWRPISLENTPSNRNAHTAVWDGSQMIVWGGTHSEKIDDYIKQTPQNDGGLYDPIADKWISLSAKNAPTPRACHAAVWTGTEMIIWGGTGTGVDGGRYDPNKPVADSWAQTNLEGAPSHRESPKAVWAGTEMIVWGDQNGACGGSLTNSGARYRP